jgi:hypothetical protein
MHWRGWCRCSQPCRCRNQGTPEMLAVPCSVVRHVFRHSQSVSGFALIWSVLMTRASTRWPVDSRANNHVDPWVEFAGRTFLLRTNGSCCIHRPLHSTSLESASLSILPLGTSFRALFGQVRGLRRCVMCYTNYLQVWSHVYKVYTTMMAGGRAYSSRRFIAQSEKNWQWLMHTPTLLCLDFSICQSDRKLTTAP